MFGRGSDSPAEACSAGLESGLIDTKATLCESADAGLGAIEGQQSRFNGGSRQKHRCHTQKSSGPGRDDGGPMAAAHLLT